MDDDQMMGMDRNLDEELDPAEDDLEDGDDDFGPVEEDEEEMI